MKSIRPARRCAQCPLSCGALCNTPSVGALCGSAYGAGVGGHRHGRACAADPPAACGRCTARGSAPGVPHQTGGDARSWRDRSRAPPSLCGSRPPTRAVRRRQPTGRRRRRASGGAAEGVAHLAGDGGGHSRWRRAYRSAHEAAADGGPDGGSTRPLGGAAQRAAATTTGDHVRLLDRRVTWVGATCSRRPRDGRGGERRRGGGRSPPLPVTDVALSASGVPMANTPLLPAPCHYRPSP